MRLRDCLRICSITTVQIFDTITESTQIMYDIVNEAVDLNSLKLALMGFKKKIKDLGAKEKEASRDIDMTFNHFIKGVKNFYGATSKREQNYRKGRLHHRYLK